MHVSILDTIAEYIFNNILDEMNDFAYTNHIE